MSMRHWLRRCQHVVLLVLPALLTMAASAAEAPDAPAETTPEQRERLKKWLAVKTWHVQVRVQISGSGRKQVGAHRQGYSVNRLAEYKFRLEVRPEELKGLSVAEQGLKRFPNDPRFIEAYELLSTKRTWEPDMQARKEKLANGEVNFVVADSETDADENWDESGRGPDYLRERALAGSKGGAEHINATFTIDLKKGTYEMQLPPDMLETVETIASTQRTQNKTSKSVMSATGWDGRIKDELLWVTNNILSGKTTLKNVGPNGYGHDFGRVRGAVEWTLSPEPLPDVLLLLTPDNYDDWLPRGGKTETDPGSTIKVRAWLKARNGSLGETKITEISFLLAGVSREPGVCLNRPLKKGAEMPDLQFMPTANAGYLIDRDGSRAHIAKGKFTEASVVVTAFDWGAWGDLIAMAWLTDGRLVYGKVENTLLEDVLRLPKRDPDSRIGEKWKRDMGAMYVSDTDDSELNTGRRKNGDRLTAYEEYRGLIAQGKHTRDHGPGRDGHKPLSPLRKDLVVYNPFKGRYAAATFNPWLDLVEETSGYHVVLVGDGEIPRSLLVNINRKTASAGEVYGMRLGERTDEQ